MKAIIYNQLTGKPDRIYSGSTDYAVVQVQAGESILFVGDSFFLTDYYVDPETAEIRDIPTKPNDYSEFNWQTKQWEALADWLDKARKDNITTVNNLSSQKILPKYPIYLQLNLPYDFGQDSVEVQTMRTWIDSVRTLANTAKAEIVSATTLPEITTIVDNFKQELAEIS
jgi:hypothetical protein